MKHTLPMLLLFLSAYAQAQLTISGRINGVHQPQLLLINPSFDCWYYKQLSQPVHTDPNGYFSVSVQVQKPQTIFAEYGKQRMLLYVEPGKHVSFSFDSADLIRSLQFSGPLKNENNFRTRTGLNFFTLNPQNRNDSLSSPREIISAIRKNQKLALEELSAVKKTTSKAFQTLTKADIEYFVPFKMWDLVFSRRDPLKQDKKAWQQALQMAYGQQPLSNPQAVNSYYYQNMVAYYPRYLQVIVSGKEAVDSLLESVLKKPSASAMQDIKEKGEQFWEYNAFSTGLHGLSLEYAIASLISNGVHSGELEYLQEVYHDFVFRFPESIYRLYVDQAMSPYLSSQSAKTPADILFEPASANNSNLSAVLRPHKGHVVYIDLWGSWCAPCREEFAYTRQLKAYFADQPVDFLYLAFEHNRGNPEAIWKKTVKFYQLTGRHILAGDTLKADIGKLYGPGGVKSFPGYILVDKEGTIQNLSAERPSSADKLYKQIEHFLK